MIYQCIPKPLQNKILWTIVIGEEVAEHVHFRDVRVGGSIRFVLDKGTCNGYSDGWNDVMYPPDMRSTCLDHVSWHPVASAADKGCRGSPSYRHCRRSLSLSDVSTGDLPFLRHLSQPSMGSRDVVLGTHPREAEVFQPRKRFKTSELPLSATQRSTIDELLHTIKKKGEYDTLRKKVWSEFVDSVSIFPTVISLTT